MEAGCIGGKVGGSVKHLAVWYMHLCKLFLQKKKSNNKEAEIKYTLSKCLHIINSARLWTTPWIEQADVCFYSWTGSEWCAGSRCWCAQEIATQPFIFISCRNLTSSLTNTPIKPLGVCRSHHRGWTGTNGSPAALSILFSSPRTMATWE